MSRILNKTKSTIHQLEFISTCAKKPYSCLCKHTKLWAHYATIQEVIVKEPENTRAQHRSPTTKPTDKPSQGHCHHPSSSSLSSCNYSRVADQASSCKCLTRISLRASFCAIRAGTSSKRVPHDQLNTGRCKIWNQVLCLRLNGVDKLFKVSKLWLKKVLLGSQSLMWLDSQIILRELHAEISTC